MQESTFDNVTIVCVTYQSRAVMASLARTVRAFPRVLVIDNASTDGTLIEAGQRIPHAQLVQRKENAGFGKACNEAVARVTTPLTLLLNPDCEISPETLRMLVATLDRYSSAAVVSPQSWRPGNKPQKCFRAPFYEKAGKKPYRLADATCSTHWLNGCCLLLRTEAFRQIGGFDEQFFLFYEDDDLCLRLRSAGFECLLEPAAHVRHAGGASSAPSARTSFTRSFHYARSRHLAIRKYLGESAGRTYLIKLMLAAVPLAVIYALLLRRRHVIKWVAWGFAAANSALKPPVPPDAEPLGVTQQNMVP